MVLFPYCANQIGEKYFSQYKKRYETPNIYNVKKLQIAYIYTVKF